MISRIWPSAVGFIVRHRPIYLMLFPIIIVRRRVLRILQRILDYFFKNVEAGSLVISIPAFQGSFEMDFRSNLLKRALVEKHFEPDIAQLVKKHVDPFKDVLDIGANVGFYTILFSKIISESNKVLAIEPAPLALEYLRRNIARNGCTQLVLVFEGIATDSKGTYLLNIIPGMEEFSSIGKIVHPPSGTKGVRVNRSQW